MSGFSAQWLALRESYDRAARNPVVLQAALDALAGRPSPRIVDLACGTGSTLRALAPRLGRGQRWRLVDHDSELLARAAESAAALNVPAITVAADLARDLHGALAVPSDLIATSALLDLVSGDWLASLVENVAARRCPLYAALSYDGRIAFEPSHPLDGAIADAVNVHQRGDKGFGPALGPSAAAAAISRLERCGFSVVHGPADWLASAKDGEFQFEIVRGWATAVRELASLPAREIDEWLAFRRQVIAEGGASLRVGHVDIFAMPR
jgi:SAM-dependent methyltransferase